MNKLTLICVLLFLITSCTYPPHVLDENGNPFFNSISLNNKQYNEYEISENYYTIIGNINNPNSSVFVSNKPTMEQVWKFATTHPSYFWIIHKNRDVIKMISLNENLQEWESNWQWLIVDVKNNTKSEVPTYFKGALTEHRFHEITHPDSLMSAKLDGKGTLIPFQKKIYGVVHYNQIYEELKSLVEKYKLYDENVNISMINIEPKRKPENKIEKASISECDNSNGTFIIKNGNVNINLEKCLQLLYENQKRIKEAGQKCHIVRFVLNSKDSGKTTNKINEISHDFDHLPTDEHQFIYSFFPSFHKCDTFEIISETEIEIITGIRSSNSTFRYFLDDVKLHFNKDNFQLIKISGNVQMHSKKWDKATDETIEETNMCPYTIEYRKIKDFIMPFTSSYMQEMKHGGIISFRIDEMHYEY